jgi:enediyne polyketide synthase
MGMEAMAQVAKALEQSELPPHFRDLRFTHPIVVPREKAVTIRIAGLRTEPGHVSVVIRCSSTAYKIDHFSGECVFEEPAAVETLPYFGSRALPAGREALPLDPDRDLYGRILFHRGRFARIEAYESLHATESIARLGAAGAASWFARHLSPELVLGDPASRDAALHSIQACIPHRTLLPVGMDRITLAADWTRTGAIVHAVERASDGDCFVYDVRMEDASGKVCEQWEALHLRAVAPIEAKGPWPLALLVPFLERRTREIFGNPEIQIGLVSTVQKQKEGAARKLVSEILGPESTLGHRPDGKPEVSRSRGGAAEVSFSHSSGLTLLLAADTSAGCDLEEVICRDLSCWGQMLGAERFALAKLLASESKGNIEACATQVWTLQESLRKAGAGFEQPISFVSCSADGWALFRAGEFRAASWQTNIGNSATAFAFGFVLKSTR